MIDRTLRLTWRKALVAMVVYAALLLAHLAVARLLRFDEPVLLLTATLGFAMWAVSAAVYTLDVFTLSPGRGRRPPAH